MQFSIALQLVTDNGQAEHVPSLVFTLLQEVRDNGNLTIAAKNAGVSYRKAWNLLGHWSTVLGSPLLDATKGRGATLTELGSRVLWAQNYLDTRGISSLEEVIAHVQSELRSVLPQPGSKTMDVSASHCVCLDILQNLYQGATSRTFSLTLHGSQTSLARLHSGHCQLAGFHLAEGDMGNGYMDIYGKAVNLSAISAVLSHQRQQGLIVARGNPLAIEGVTDLLRSNARIVNRQNGSGTRVLFDLLISKSGIQGSDIPGYEDIELTDTAVCARIANQQADAALGTEASAAQFGLGFIPLVGETYYFGFRQRDIDTESITGLVSLLGSGAWTQAINQIPGMRADGAGKVIKSVETFSF